MTKKNEKKNEPTQDVEALLGDTEAGKIWSAIKDKNIEMFALPDQKVHQYCVPVPIEPSKLYLRTTATSALPSLEAACGKNFTVELIGSFVVVARAVVPLTK